MAASRGRSAVRRLRLSPCAPLQLPCVDPWTQRALGRDRSWGVGAVSCALRCTWHARPQVQTQSPELARRRVRRCRRWRRGSPSARVRCPPRNGLHTPHHHPLRAHTALRGTGGHRQTRTQPRSCMPPGHGRGGGIWTAHRPWSLWSPAFHPPSAPHGASPEAPGSGAGAWVLQLALRNGVPAALPLPEAGVRQDGAVDSSLQTEPCGEEARPVECRSRQPLLWVLSLDLHPIPTCLTHRGQP